MTAGVDALEDDDSTVSTGPGVADIDEDQLLLLRAVLLDGPAARAAWVEWRERIDFDDVDAPSHRMLPLLARRMGDIAPDDPIRGLVSGIYRHAWGRNQLLIRDAAQIVDVLSAAGIPAIVLKGTALLAYYGGDWGARPMYDVDFLVPRDRVPEAATALAERGWTPQAGLTLSRLQAGALQRRNGWGFDREPSGHLDLHWRVLAWSVGEHADDEFWADAQPFELGPLRALQLHPADLLFHVLEHGRRSGPTNHTQWVIDATMILRGTDRDVVAERLTRQARAHAAVGLVVASLDRLVEITGDPSAAVVRDRVAATRPRTLERVAESDRVPSRVRRKVQALRRFGGGTTSLAGSARGLVAAQLDLPLSTHRVFTVAYAASGRPAGVAVAGRRAFGSFVRTASPEVDAVALGSTLDFTDAEVCDRHAGPGWDRQGGAGVALRVTGREGRLVVPLHVPLEQPLSLTVELQGERRRASTVEVAVNERTVGEVGVRPGRRSVATFVVSPELVNRFQPLEITFRGPRTLRAPRRATVALSVVRIELR